MTWLPESTNLDVDKLGDRSTKFENDKFDFENEKVLNFTPH